MVALRQEVGRPPEIGFVPLVTSANFETFTRSIGPVPADKEDFASPLYLAQFTQDLQGLYAIDTPVHVYSEEDRQALLSVVNGVHYDDPDIRQAINQVKQQITDFANLQGRAENGILYYFDTVRGERDVTRPFSNGAFDMLQPNIGQVIDAGNKPMILVHGHPDDPFLSDEERGTTDEELAFSYDDIAYNLLGLKAQILLGRGKALLGCSTLNTPLLSLAELDEYFVESEQEFAREGGEERTILEQQAHEAQQNALRRWGQQVDESSKVVSFLDAKRKRGILTPNEEVSLATASLARQEAIQRVAEDPEYKLAQDRYFEFLKYVDRRFAMRLLDRYSIVLFETYDLSEYNFAA